MPYISLEDMPSDVPHFDSLDSIESSLEKRFSTFDIKSIKDLPHPHLLHNVKEASNLIVECMLRGEQIIIVGDYDCDGVCATCIMLDFFEALGYEVDFIIPNRFLHGYGFSVKLFDEIMHRFGNVDLIITVDNGISSFEAAKLCKESGIKLIITDHHTLDKDNGLDRIPTCDYLINPKQSVCTFPYEDICGALVAWYLCSGIKIALLNLDEDSCGELCKIIYNVERSFSSIVLSESETSLQNQRLIDSSHSFIMTDLHHVRMTDSRHVADNATTVMLSDSETSLKNLDSKDSSLPLRMTTLRHVEALAETSLDSKHNKPLESNKDSKDSSSMPQNDTISQNPDSSHSFRMTDLRHVRMTDSRHVADNATTVMLSDSETSLNSKRNPPPQITQEKNTERSVPQSAKNIYTQKVTYNFIKELKRNIQNHLNMKDLLILAGLATLSDVMPLNSLNHTISRFSISQMKRTNRAAFRIFSESNSYIDSQTLGFRLIPLINAAGRVEEATIALYFLRSKNLIEAKESFTYLIDLNEKRKELQDIVAREAFDSVEQFLQNDSMICVVGDDWHDGVLGIVAGRMANEFRKPCFVLVRKNVTYKGSGRSYGNVDLIASLQGLSEVLRGYGGHVGAVGLEIECNRISDFINEFRPVFIDSTSSSDTFGSIDSNLLSDELLDILYSFEPYGNGNMLPKFLVKLEIMKFRKMASGFLEFFFHIKNGMMKGFYFSDKCEFEFREADVIMCSASLSFSSFENRVIIIVDRIYGLYRD